MASRDRETDQAMSDKELIDEVLTLIVAGHETTAAALTWTWYLVSQHPEAQAQLQAEADRTSTDQTPWAWTPPSRWPSPIKCCRRRCGSIRRAGSSRGARSRRTNSAAIPIAPRTDVFISPYMLHRHPAFWSEPEEFKPERFAGTDAEERHRFAYIPFAVGPRHCIGENIAMFEMLVHVHAMSRRFRLTRAGDRTH